MGNLTLTSDQDGDTIEARLGDTVELHLPENPTTGYRWQVETLGPGLEIEFDQFRIEGTVPIPGAGGVHEWHMTATSKGHQPVRLRLWRDWEGDDSVIRRFNLDIEVG